MKHIWVIEKKCGIEWEPKAYGLTRGFFLNKVDAETERVVAGNFFPNDELRVRKYARVK